MASAAHPLAHTHFLPVFNLILVTTSVGNYQLMNRKIWAAMLGVTMRNMAKHANSSSLQPWTFTNLSWLHLHSETPPPPQRRQFPSKNSHSLVSIGIILMLACLLLPQSVQINWSSALVRLGWILSLFSTLPYQSFPSLPHLARGWASGRSENSSSFQGQEKGEWDFSLTVKPQFLQVLFCFHFFYYLKGLYWFHFPAPRLCLQHLHKHFVLLRMKSAMDPSAYTASAEHRGLCSNVRIKLWVSRYKPLNLLGLGLTPIVLWCFSILFVIKGNPSTRNLRQPSLVRGCIAVCQMLEQPERL